MARLITGDLSQTVRIGDIPADGLDVNIAANQEECADLARLFELPAVTSLRASLRLARQGLLVRVTGRMEALVTQTCVVSLDPFDDVVTEEIMADFAEDSALARQTAKDAEPEHEVAIDLDAPEPAIDGKIDLGRLLAEYLAVGLDPYPRKPGATFEPYGDSDGERPLAALGKLLQKPEA